MRYKHLSLKGEVIYGKCDTYAYGEKFLSNSIRFYSVCLYFNKSHPLSGGRYIEKLVFILPVNFLYKP